MSTTALTVTDLGKRFRVLKQQRSLLRMLRALAGGHGLREDFWALRGISFTVQKGQSVALVGGNGAGKTTLLRIIAGILAHTRGTIESAHPAEAVFSLAAGMLEDLPVVENLRIFQAIYGIPDPGRRRLDEALELAELSDHRYALLRELSRGQRQRLVLSVVFQSPAELFLFDESFSFLDERFQKVGESHFERLRRQGRTVILASHDHAMLRRHCDHALWLERGELRGSGPAEVVLDEYEKASRAR